MKKVKLFSNFLSATDKMFSKIAVLFTNNKTATTLVPVKVRMPVSPRRRR